MGKVYKAGWIKQAETVLFFLSLGSIVWIITDMVLHCQAFYLILFCFIYVFAPGICFLYMINPSLLRDKGWMLLISVYFGFFLLVAQYYLLNLLNVLPAIRFVPIIVLLAELTIIIIKEKRTNKDSSGNTESVWTLNEILPFIMMLAIFMLYAHFMMKKTVPDDKACVFIDYLYHMGNISTLTKGGSIMDPRIFGVTFRYHYFMELFYAILRNVFPATIFNCVFRYPILLIPVVVCGSFYKLILLFVKNKNASAVSAALTLFFADMIPGYTHLTSHVGTNINAVGFALPCAILLAYLLSTLLLHPEKGKNSGFYILIFGIGLCLAGLKGPFAMMIAGAAMLMSAYLLIHRDKAAEAFLFGTVMCLLSFGIIWVSLLRTAVNAENLEAESRVHGLIRFYMTVPPPFSGLVDGGSKKAVLLLPYSMIIAFGFLVIPFAFAVIDTAISTKKRTKADKPAILLVLISLLSVGAYYTLAVAQNRVYFLMLATPFIAALAMGWIQEARNKRKSSWKIVLLISTLLLLTACFNSIKNPKVYYGSGNLSQDDISAVAWIRDHTPEDAILAINDHEYSVRLEPVNPEYRATQSEWQRQSESS